VEVLSIFGFVKASGPAMAMVPIEITEERIIAADYLLLRIGDIFDQHLHPFKIAFVSNPSRVARPDNSGRVYIISVLEVMVIVSRVPIICAIIRVPKRADHPPPLSVIYEIIGLPVLDKLQEKRLEVVERLSCLSGFLDHMKSHLDKASVFRKRLPIG